MGRPFGIRCARRSILIRCPNAINSSSVMTETYTNPISVELFNFSLTIFNGYFNPEFMISTKRPRSHGLLEAYKAAGTLTAIADYLDLTPQAVSNWREVPAIYVIPVSELTGIPPHRIRP